MVDEHLARRIAHPEVGRRVEDGVLLSGIEQQMIEERDAVAPDSQTAKGC